MCDQNQTGLLEAPANFKIFTKSQKLSGEWQCVDF